MNYGQNNDFNNNVYPFSNQNLGNGYTQPTQQTQINAGPIQQSSENSNNSYMNITPEKKDNKKILIIIILLIVGGLAFMGYKYFLSDVIESKKELYNTTSFFFENYQGEIALFSSEGEQLTDFMFTNYEGFVTNKAIVWKDKEVGIIKSSTQ